MTPIDTDRLRKAAVAMGDAPMHVSPADLLALLDRLAAVEGECERLRKREADLFEMVKRCERDVQRAFRWNAEDGDVQHFAVACEAIQQRAAGIAPPATVEESEG